jgi:hypothetical protein
MALVSVLLDLMVAILLAATIFYAVILNRKLGDLRNNKAEMEAMVNRLVQSTEQAEHGLADLKAAAGEKGEELGRTVEAARTLAEDLNFLVDKGGSLADRLERQLGQARKATAPAGPAVLATDPPAAGGEPVAEPANTPHPPRTPKAERAEAAQASAPATQTQTQTQTPRPNQNTKLLKALRGVR